MKEEKVRIIFGLKLRQLRTDAGLSLTDLSHATGLSVSYLNEIEKGKKYPKTEKILALAKHLKVSYDQMVSLKLGKNLAPLADLIQSNLLDEIPFELFGIDILKIIELIAEAPAKVSAFISTLIQIARHYDLSSENFYLSALRAYQEMHENYFEELEQAAENFAKTHALNAPLPNAKIEQLVVDLLGFEIDKQTIGKHSIMHALRSIYLPKGKGKLLLNPNLSDRQEVFVYARELAFAQLNLTVRPFTSSEVQINSFEEVLNNFKASYFAAALILPRKPLITDLAEIFEQPQWQPQALLHLIFKYNASAESFLQRLTGILAQHFGIKQLFFLRFTGSTQTDLYTLTKEFHLSKQHNPHGTQLDEHYCRRWNAIKAIETLKKEIASKPDADLGPRLFLQRSAYFETKDEYLVMSIARPVNGMKNMVMSITLGLLLNADLKKRIKFWNDPAIQQITVNETCERCAISNCLERKAAAKVLEKQKNQQALLNAIEMLDKKSI